MKIVQNGNYHTITYWFNRYTGGYDSMIVVFAKQYVISLYGSVAKTDGRFMILVRLPSPFLPQIRIRIAQMNSDFL